MPGNNVRRTPIAIVGIAAVAPMAEDTPRFWQNILDKVDAITEVPPSRWEVADYYDPDPTAPDKTYSKVGGFLPAIPFDPLEFGIPPNILEFIDTSQLLSLVLAKRVLADAGYLHASAALRERTGVILGVGGGQTLIGPLLSRLQAPVLEAVLRSIDLSQAQIDTLLQTFARAYVPWEENAFPGLLGNVIAGRITNRLDLGGTNCVVDAACASSVSALKMAVSELQEGHADMMITGGVDTDTSPFMYLSFSKTPALSKRGTSRPFDRSADGMLIGEAITMFCLKRLSDAERDNDRIYAVVRGLGASSDGRAKSIYAPRASGQVLAMRRAYDDAGISPATVDIFEAHGTGTARGDATELDSISTLLTDNGVGPGQVAVGSIKSQVGHTKAAAGGVSMAKIALALHHKILPPSINVEHPNEALAEPTTPLYVNTEARPWVRRGHPRRAGVSSFGFGGTNFHVILEEHTPPTDSPLRAHRMHATPQMVILHAADAAQLADTLQGHLRAATRLAHLAYPANADPLPDEHARVGFVAADDDEAQQKLQQALDHLRANPGESAWELRQGIIYRRGATPGKVVALFPGQGSQYVNMGRDLLNHFPHVQTVMEHFDDAFPGGALREIVYPPPAFDDSTKQAQSARLTQTEHAQPALGALSMMLFSLLRGAGFQPDILAGHSFGELTALWAAGVLSDDDFIRLAVVRGQAMKARAGGDAGGMAAVIGDVAALETHLRGTDGVHVANFNSNRQAVIAGAQHALDGVTPVLQRGGYRVIPLTVSAAFHTPLVGHAQAAFAEALSEVTLHTSQSAVYANSTAEQYPGFADGIRETLTDHILNPVRFREQIEAIHRDGGRVFVEIGPRNVLTRLLEDILTRGAYDAVALNPNAKGDSDRQFREAAAKLVVLGVHLRNIDPYAPPPNDSPKESGPLTVMLDGANYVSDKTQQAYEAQLSANRATFADPAPAIQTSHPTNSVTPDRIFEESRTVTRSDTPTQRPHTSTDAHHLFLELQRDFNQRVSALYAQAMELAHSQPHLAEQVLHQLGDLQTQNRDVAQAHILYMQAMSGNVQAGTHGHGAPWPAAPEPATASDPLLAQFLHNSAHNGDRQGQSNGLRLSYDIPPSPPAPVAEASAAPAPVRPSPTVTPAPKSGPIMPPLTPKNPPSAIPPMPRASESPPSAPPQGEAPPVSDDMLTTLLGIVSDKTGYPVDLLEPTMSLEADLGIDSIKRVEILGVMQDTVPGLPPLKPDEMARLDTLGEIADYIRGQQTANFSQGEGGRAPSSPAATGELLTRNAVLTSLPAPDRLLWTLPAGTVALVTDDGSTLVDAVVEALHARGWNVVRLALPRVPHPQTPFTLADSSAAAIETALAQISASHGTVGALIHIVPIADYDALTLTDPAKASAKLAFFLTKHLREPLHRTAEHGRAACLFITRADGKLGTTGTAGDVVSGGLSGFLKSVAVEWPQVFCRLVDIAPNDPNAAAYILAELDDPNTHLAEIGYADGVRYTLNLEPRP